MIRAISTIFRIIGKMFVALFKRGKGIFKALFVIDDLFRIFTMTFLFPILFSWIGLGSTGIMLGVLLGLVIDVHDFMTTPENYEVLRVIRRR